MRSSCLVVTVGLVSALAACSDDPVYWPYGTDVGTGDTTGADATTDAAADSSIDTTPSGCVVENDPVCGDYLCEVGTGECFTSCVFGDECAPGRACDIIDGSDSGVCVSAGVVEYLYVAIVSTAVGTDALDNPNPGPDIDVITVSRGGEESAPDEVVAFQEGEEGDETNLRPLSTHSNAVLLGDTVTRGFCDLDAQPGYVALGGSDGFVVVGMPFALEAGDQIVVYEVNSDSCIDVAAERPDTYEVYATNDVSFAMAPGTADDIRSEWCLVGSSGATGGVLTATFTCGM